MTQDPRTWDAEARVSAAHARLDQAETTMGELMAEIGSVGRQVSAAHKAIDTNNRLLVSYHNQVVAWRKESNEAKEIEAKRYREFKATLDGLLLSVNSATRSVADSQSDLSEFKQEVRKSMNLATALVIVACIAAATFFGYRDQPLPHWLGPIMTGVALFIVSTLKPVSEKAQATLYSIVGKKK